MADIDLDGLADFGLASVIARPGAGFDSHGLWPVAPGQWLAYVDHAAPDWAETLGEHWHGTATVVDQSSAYAGWRVTGGDAQRLLQKGLPVDLAMLVPGGVVVSAIAHIGVIVHCDAPGQYTVAVFRSFAHSFREWLQASVAAL